MLDIFIEVVHIALLYIDFSRPDWHTLIYIMLKYGMNYLLIKLKPYIHLFRENEIIKENDQIAGLGKPAKNDIYNINRLFSLPLNPKSIVNYTYKKFNLHISRPNIKLPSNFENDMLWSLRQTRSGYWEGDNAIIKNVTRNLHIGLHNGLTFITEPYISINT